MEIALPEAIKTTAITYIPLGFFSGKHEIRKNFPNCHYHITLWSLLLLPLFPLKFLFPLLDALGTWPRVVAAHSTHVFLPTFYVHLDLEAKKVFMQFPYFMMRVSTARIINLYHFQLCVPASLQLSINGRHNVPTELVTRGLIQKKVTLTQCKMHSCLAR